ncbi:hypothetical protein ACFQZZ_14910 [Nocardia sp. GCM10030253]|uniref:hypothetical protein n=1 Tax=Nocardia sp. GCM10030253 TaxID=3273404 RepID=UPI003642B9F3
MSEMDEIGRDTGRTFREIINVARGWIHQHRTTHRTDAVRKLTRKERRDLAEAVRVQVGEERIAAAWFTKRVNDYQREAATSQERLTPDSSVDEWMRSSERLNGIRYSIESTLHSTALSLEHRGQVVQALDAVEADPGTRVEKVFPQLDAETAIEARATAVHSEQWVAREQARNERILAEQRAAAERRANPIPHLTAENAELRRRISELEQQSSSPQPTQRRTDGGKQFVVLVGPSSVVPLEGHESAAVPHADRPRVQDFATREEAYAWTLNQLDTYRDTSSRRAEDFTANIRDRNVSDGGQRVDGPIGMVTDEVRELYQDHRHRNRSEQPQPQEDRTRPAAAQEAPVDARIAEIEKQLREMSEDRDRFASRVGVLQRGLDAVTADRDGMKTKLEAATGQIEELKVRNVRLAAEIGQVADRPGMEAVAAERDRYKRERDEAVAKLAQATPEHERYGSRTRNPSRDGHRGGPDVDGARAVREAHERIANTAAAQRGKSSDPITDRLVAKNLADAGFDADPEVIARQVRALAEGGSPEKVREAEQFVDWWGRGGADAYRAEMDKRRQAERQGDTQAWSREDRDDARGYERNGNGQPRNGIERSR